MKATAGDRITLAGEHVGQATRAGEVLEVRGADGEPPYLVRWDDGHTGLITPGPGSVLRTRSSAAPSDSAGTPAARHHTWHVEISLSEQGDDTTATATLRDTGTGDIVAKGFSHRGKHDPSDAQIGDEVAVARALRHLAEQLIDTAVHDIEVSTGEHDVFVRSR